MRFTSSILTLDYHLMNFLDIAIGSILIFSFIFGLKRGLFVTLASLLGLIAGVYCAIYFSGFAAAYISRWFDWSTQFTNSAAFVVTFLAVVAAISWAGKFLTKLVDLAFLGIFNKILGGLFQALTSAFILSVIFMFLNSSERTSDIIPEGSKEDSRLYTPVASIAPVILPFIIKEIEELDPVRQLQEDTAEE